MAVTTPNKARTKPGSTPAESVWDEIRARLERRRDEILERISSYPTPIPACDVDFNRLLEERARVFEELDRLKALRLSDKSRHDDSGMKEFIASCASLSEDDRGALHALLEK
jgi:hypothetical protein